MTASGPTLLRLPPEDDSFEDTGHRWVGRPLLALLIRTVVVLIPFGASFFAVRAAGHVLGAPTGPGWTVLWWLGTIGAGFWAALVVDHVARRLLPLATLLQLTLLFPDQTPSRFHAWRRMRTEDELRRRIEHAGAAADAAVDVLGLVAALDRHDRSTRGHSERVRLFVELLAEQLRLPPADRDRLRWAALLHDVGKLDVDHDLLNKPDRPTDEEWDALRAHPHAGVTHVGPLGPWLGPWVNAIAHHHERWDGGGYPEGLQGDAISLAGRITCVADAFEVMTAPRPYRRPVGPIVAREELVAQAGSQFDPDIVRAFLEVSLPRLRAAMGPTALLAQIPAIGVIARLPARPRLLVAAAAIASVSFGFSPPASSGDAPSGTTTIVAGEHADGASSNGTGGDGQDSGEGVDVVRLPAEIARGDASSTPADAIARPPTDRGSRGSMEDSVGAPSGQTGTPPTNGQDPATDPAPEPGPSDEPEDPDVARSQTSVVVGGQGVVVALGVDENGVPFVEATPTSDPAAPTDVGTGLTVMGAGAEAGVDDNGPYVRAIFPPGPWAPAD